MDSADLAKVVNRLVAAFPAGVKGYIWTKELAELDHARAEIACDLLINSDESPPSVARFKAVYQRAGQPSGFPRPEYTGPPRSFDDMLDQYAADAAGGDAHAITHLEQWRKTHRERVDAAIARHPSTHPIPVSDDW